MWSECFPCVKRVRGVFPEASEERKPPLLAPPPAASPSPQPALQSWAPGLSSSLISLLPSSSLFPRQHSRPQRLSPLSSLRASILPKGGGSPWLHMRTRTHCPPGDPPHWALGFLIQGSLLSFPPVSTAYAIRWHRELSRVFEGSWTSTSHFIQAHVNHYPASSP